MKTTRAKSNLVVFLSALTLSGCSGKYEQVRFTSSEQSRYAAILASDRIRKDNFFKRDPASPLTSDERKSFEHLSYFPPDFNLIFKVRLIQNVKPGNTSIQATGGETRSAVRFGTFEFAVDGKPVRLTIYKMSEDASNELFLPFKDLTCGVDSYAGGRYLDLEENSSQEYVLDFNYCYNPYCSYNHGYSCPIVPEENRIDVSIPAGEKLLGK